MESDATQDTQTPVHGHTIPPFYGVYLLRSIPKSKSFYIGSTPNPDRRLKQHNGELVSGAYRTKRDGFRPWKMIVVVGGFPSKISALQFEHAFQHPHITRHITRKRVSGSARSGKNSLPSMLANLRLLLSSEYFGVLDLSVNIIDEEALEVWNKNKHGIEVENTMGYVEGHQMFLDGIKEEGKRLDDIFDELKDLLLRRQSCERCNQDIDLIPEFEGQVSPLVTMTPCCKKVYHLACIGRSLLPKHVTCKECGQELEWIKLVSVSTRIRRYFAQG